MQIPKKTSGRRNVLFILILTVAAAVLLCACGAGVDIGEADKVLASFQMVLPGDFEGTCITGVPVPVTIRALDQNGELFGTWSGTVSIEKDNVDVTLSHETVEIANGTKQVDLAFTVTGEETVKIRVRYGETSSSWSALITVQRVFSIATIVPGDGSFLVGHQAVKITFNDSTETGSLAVGGDLGAYTTSWDSVTYTNDTLTLSPDGFWNDDERSLTVGCDVAGGGQSDSRSLTYDVLHGMFVRLSDSDDSYDGTTDEPKATIGGAIDGIVNVEGYETAEVRVAEGACCGTR